MKFVTSAPQTANAEKIIEDISLLRGKQINEKTLLIFDEIQECPNIISSLKYFCQDFREIPVIATGSMVRIKLQRETRKRGLKDNNKFLFPVGKINQITVYPMTFDEFLMNSNSMLYDAVKKAYETKRPLNTQIHNLAMEQVYKYMLIGGMPEAVEAYIDDGDILEAREILKVLYDNYLADMELYQASREAVLRSRTLFQNIYRELNKESKNFSPGLIEEKSKTRDFATSIQWLTMAHIINQSFQLKEHITMPLIPDNDSNFRLFLGDIGMFSYQSGINAASFVSKERENTLSGIFFENFAANELIAKGHKLFYWRGKAYSELEFIIESDNKLYPVDIKKAKEHLTLLKNLQTTTNLNLLLKYQATITALTLSRNCSLYRFILCRLQQPTLLQGQWKYSVILKRCSLRIITRRLRLLFNYIFLSFIRPFLLLRLFPRAICKVVKILFNKRSVCFILIFTHKIIAHNFPQSKEFFKYTTMFCSLGLRSLYGQV